MRTKGRDNGRTGTAHSGIALGPWSVGVSHDKERQHTKTLHPATCMSTAAGRTCEAELARMVRNAISAPTLPQEESPPPLFSPSALHAEHSRHHDKHKTTKCA